MSEVEKNGSESAALMLQIRAEALRAHLTRITGLLSKVPNRRKILEQLETNLSTIKDSTFEVDSKIYRCRRMFEYERNAPIPTTDADVRLRLERLTDKIRDLVQMMEELQDVNAAGDSTAMATLKSITEMKQNCFLIEPSDPPGEMLGEDLKQRTKPALSVLDELDMELARKAPNAELWQKYRDRAYAPSQKIFAEYVDFLGGLALRDTGFDEGISRIAEDLIRTYKTKSRPPYPPMALPVRQEAVARTLARVVRVGFPEWTVWALPFTAHEFWHAIAREGFDQVMREALTKQKKIAEGGKIPERYQTCLADAFATYTMGPAYAYSAVFLLLSPLSAYAPPEPVSALPCDPGAPESVDDAPIGDDTRAQAILQMLRLMGKHDSAAEESPYVVVSNQLGKIWSAAMSAAAVRPAGARTEQDNGTVIAMVEALWNLLESCPCSPFPTSEWNQLPKLEQVLVDQPLAVGELRKVLNTIWKWRVGTHDTQQMDTVAEKVRDRILKRTTGQPAAPSPHLGKVAPGRG